jgi:hypothetical protein
MNYLKPLKMTGYIKKVSKQKETELDEHGYLVNLGDLRKSYLATHRMLANKKSELLADIEKLSDGLPLIELKKKEGT